MLFSRLTRAHSGNNGICAKSSVWLSAAFLLAYVSLYHHYTYRLTWRSRPASAGLPCAASCLAAPCFCLHRSMTCRFSLPACSLDAKHVWPVCNRRARFQASKLLVQHSGQLAASRFSSIYIYACASYLCFFTAKNF